MKIQRLATALAPHLPQQTLSGGAGATQLQAACHRHAQAPAAAPHPYPEGTSQREAVGWSRALEQLGSQAQAAFREKLGNGGAELRLSQLQSSLRELQIDRERQAAQDQQQISGLRRSFYSQVGRTAAWMGATLGSLLVTGVFPNPVTAVVAVATGGMCIRSIGKARTAAKEMGAQIPQLKDSARVALQIAGDAAQCGPLVGAWAGLLESPARAAA